MNVERRQAASDPRPSQTTQAVSPPVQAATDYTHNIAIYCYYSARKLILILPSHGRQKAESTYLAGYIPRWFTRPQTVTHPGTNRVWRSATTLIEGNPLPLSQTANVCLVLLILSFMLNAVTLQMLIMTKCVCHYVCNKLLTYCCPCMNSRQQVRMA